MSVTIKIIGRVDDTPTAFDGQYVSRYDPTVHELNGNYMGGILETTADINAAIQFPSFIEASECWKQTPGCKCHATRPWDGKPNRPLTGFHVGIQARKEAGATI